MSSHRPSKRYSIIDLDELMKIDEFSKIEKLQESHRACVEAEITRKPGTHDVIWSESTR